MEIHNAGGVVGWKKPRPESLKFLWICVLV